MTDAEKPEGDDALTASQPQKRPGERLAKAIARAGLGSRREAEGWIAQGRVAVNGVRVEAASVNVVPGDRVEVDGRPLPERERTRLWLYHKPRGYVTTTHDPEGRDTVFSILPESLPRVMTIGRLDINTEGLLLLTNDGGLARVLELPETGWLRRYRVRAFGRTTPEALAALKDGVEIDGFAYGAIEAEIERQQADNVWLRFALREGKNREVKRVAEHLGLAVNRLIRISFGPFQLGQLPEGGVEEVRTRTLKDQLGKRLSEEAGLDFEAPVADRGEDAPRKTGGRGGARAAAAPERSRLADPNQRVGRRAPIARPRDMSAPSSAPEAGEKPQKTKRAAPVADRRGRTVKVERVARDEAAEPQKRVRRRDDGAAERFGAKGRPARPERADVKDARGPRPPRREDAAGGERPARGPRGEGRPPRDREGSSARRPGRDDGAAPDRAARPPRARPFEPRGERASSGDRPRPQARSSAPRWRDEAPDAPGRAEGGPRPERAPREGRPAGGGKPGGRSFAAGKPGGKPSGGRSFGGKPGAGGARPEGDRPRGPRPSGAKPGGPRSGGQKSGGDRPFGGKPHAGGPRPDGDRPRGSRPSGSGPGGSRSGGGKPGGFKPRGPGGAPRGGGGGKGRPGGADRRR